MRPSGHVLMLSGGPPPPPGPPPGGPPPPPGGAAPPSADAFAAMLLGLGPPTSSVSTYEGEVGHVVPGAPPPPGSSLPPVLTTYEEVRQGHMVTFPPPPPPVFTPTFTVAAHGAVLTALLDTGANRHALSRGAYHRLLRAGMPPWAPPRAHPEASLVSAAGGDIRVSHLGFLRLQVAYIRRAPGGAPSRRDCTLDLDVSVLESLGPYDLVIGNGPDLLSLLEPVLLTPRGLDGTGPGCVFGVLGPTGSFVPHADFPVSVPSILMLAARHYAPLSTAPPPPMVAGLSRSLDSSPFTGTAAGCPVSCLFDGALVGSFLSLAAAQAIAQRSGSQWFEPITPCSVIGQPAGVLIMATGTLALEVHIRWCRRGPLGPIIHGPTETISLSVFVGILAPPHSSLLGVADLLLGGAHSWVGTVPSRLAALALWAPRGEPPEPWGASAPFWVVFRDGPDAPASQPPLNLDEAPHLRAPHLPGGPHRAMNLDEAEAPRPQEFLPRGPPPGPALASYEAQAPRPQDFLPRGSPPGPALASFRPQERSPPRSRSPPRRAERRSRSPPRRAERPREDSRRGRPQGRSRSHSSSPRPDRPRSGGGARDDGRGSGGREVRYRGADSAPPEAVAPPPPPPCQWKAHCIGRWLLKSADGVSRRCGLSHPFVNPDVLRDILYRLPAAEVRWLTSEGITKLAEYQAIDRRAAEAAAARAAAVQAAALPSRSAASRATRGARRPSAAPAPTSASAAPIVYNAAQSEALIREANAEILAQETAGEPTSFTFSYGEEAQVGRARGRRASPAVSGPMPILQALRGPDVEAAASSAPLVGEPGGGVVMSDEGFFEGQDVEPARVAGGE